MTNHAVLQRDMHLRMLGKLGVVLASDASVLDFGCGAGRTVAAYADAGFDAWGCDIAIEEPGPRVRAIERPYRLPFEDETFDFVFSDQVFEHVQDYGAAIAELARVTRPGGAGLHFFPGRLRPVEAHVFVPLAGVVQSPVWLRLWARLGVRNGFQRGMRAIQVAEINARYLEEETAYPRRAAVRAAFAGGFEQVRFCEREFIESTWGRARTLAPLANVPIVPRMLSALHTRVVLTRRPPG